MLLYTSTSWLICQKSPVICNLFPEIQIIPNLPVSLQPTKHTSPLPGTVLDQRWKEIGRSSMDFRGGLKFPKPCLFALFLMDLFREKFLTRPVRHEKQCTDDLDGFLKCAFAGYASLYPSAQYELHWRANCAPVIWSVSMLFEGWWVPKIGGL